MVATLHLGKSGRSRFTIPLDAATETIGILAKRGAGKTYTASVIAEEMLEHGLQVVIIDPLNVWWGLSSSADGRSAGYPIIVFGGGKADIPLEGSEGAATADAVVDNKLSAILSIRHLSQEGQRSFVAAFLARIYHRKGQPGKNSPMHIMIDEADAFCPQRVLPRVARCMGAVDAIVRRGRASGIGVTLITQRSAALNKDVLTQVELLITMRTTGPHDRKAVLAWVQHHDSDDPVDEFMGSLTALAVGEAWFWCPGWLKLFERVRIRKRRTFDSSATPRIGHTVKQPKRRAPIDLDALRRSLASSIEAAENTDPSALRRKVVERDRTIADLQTKLKYKPGQDYKLAMQKAVDGERHRIDRLWQHLWGTCIESVRGRLQDVLAKAVRDSLPLSLPTGFAPPAKGGQIIPDPIQSQPKQPPEVTKNQARNEQSLPANAERPRSGKWRMLMACAQFPGGISVRKIALLSGLRRTSGTFGTYLGWLRTQHFVEGPATCLLVTASGIAAAGSFEPLPTGDALREFWQTKLGGSGKRRLFDAICGAWPDAIAKTDAAQGAGLSGKSGTFGTYLGTLRTLGLLDANIESNGLLASAMLFG